MRVRDSGKFRVTLPPEETVESIVYWMEQTGWREVSPAEDESHIDARHGVIAPVTASIDVKKLNDHACAVHYEFERSVAFDLVILSFGSLAKVPEHHVRDLRHHVKTVGEIWEAHEVPGWLRR